MFQILSFSLGRRLFEEDHPLEIALDASCSHRNSKLVLRDNTYSTIQWDAFTLPELANFIQILHREEDIYAGKVRLGTVKNLNDPQFMQVHTCSCPIKLQFVLYILCPMYFYLKYLSLFLSSLSLSLSLQVKHRFELWRDLVSQVLKDKAMETVGRQTQQNIVGNSSPAPSRPTLKVESVV